MTENKSEFLEGGFDTPLSVSSIELHHVGEEYDNLLIRFTPSGSLYGYPKAKLIAHLEKSLNAFIAKTKKEEVL